MLQRRIGMMCTSSGCAVCDRPRANLPARDSRLCGSNWSLGGRRVMHVAKYSSGRGRTIGCGRLGIRRRQPVGATRPRRVHGRRTPDPKRRSKIARHGCRPGAGGVRPPRGRPTRCSRSCAQSGLPPNWHGVMRRLQVRREESWSSARRRSRRATPAGRRRRRSCPSGICSFGYCAPQRAADRRRPAARSAGVSRSADTSPTCGV